VSSCFIDIRQMVRPYAADRVNNGHMPDQLSDGWTYSQSRCAHMRMFRDMHYTNFRESQLRDSVDMILLRCAVCYIASTRSRRRQYSQLNLTSRRLTAPTVSWRRTNHNNYSPIRYLSLTLHCHSFIHSLLPPTRLCLRRRSLGSLFVC